MTRLLLLACVLFASNVFADADCYTNAQGKRVCTNGEKAVAVNPNTGTVTTAQKNQSRVTAAQTANGKSAAVVNPHSGNAAVVHTNQNGVTTTQTTRGGTAKTKNGKGVYQAPNGTTCVKTADGKGCK